MYFTPCFRESKQKVISDFERRCAQTKNVNVVMIGDSIVSNFLEYGDPKLCFPASSMLLGIPGDRIEHVWYRLIHNGIPKNAKVVIIHVGTNNLKSDLNDVIVGAIVSMCQQAVSKNKKTVFVFFRFIEKGGEEVCIIK